MAEAKKPTKKIIDVKHPGQTAPSGTSKSVIVTNRPIMKDPMVVDDEPKTDEASAAPTYKSGGEAVIKPLADQKADEQSDKPEADKSKTISQLAEEATSKSAENGKPEPEPKDLSGTAVNEPKKEAKKEPEIKLPIDDDKEDEDENKDDKSAEAKEDHVATKEEAAPLAKDEPAKDSTESEPDADNKPKPDSKDLKDTEEAEEDKALKKRKAEVAKLAESKKYYLPITTVENRHNRRAVVIGVVVSILLIVLWINIALDAGLISLGGIKPFTNFF